MMRLDETTPVRKALNEATRKAGKKKKGNFKMWVIIVNKDLLSIDLKLSLNSERLKEVAQSRSEWNGLIKSSTSH